MQLKPVSVCVCCRHCYRLVGSRALVAR